MNFYPGSSLQCAVDPREFNTPKMSASFEPVQITPQKQDPAWKHVQMFKDGDRVQLKCIYCGKIFKGGGIHRIKEHLAGQKGNASTCPQVLQDVRLIMQQSLDCVVSKRRKKQELAEEITSTSQPQPTANDVDLFANTCAVNSDIDLIENPDVLEPSGAFIFGNQDGVGVSGKSAVKRKRGRPQKKLPIPLDSHHMCVTLGNGCGTDLVSKKMSSEAHMAIGRFFYDVGLPLDAINSVYFQPMVDAIASQGTGAACTGYHDLRSWILKSSLDEVKANVEHYMKTWARIGCSILVEEWKTDKGSTVVNFLVDCTEGTMFLKSLDITNVMDSPDSIFDILKEVVEEVGVGNVLQVITSDEERYVIAGRRLFDSYSTLYWASCSAAQIGLILEDLGKLEWVSAVLEQCKSVTRFIYNHSYVLNLMRRYTYGVDLVVPGQSLSSTNFRTLKQIVSLKHNLQALITSQEWVDSLHSKKEGGLTMLDSLSDESFWSSCNLITHLTDPLLQVLDIVGDQKRPSMGYVYAGIYRAKEIIKRELQKREDYIGYWNMIDQRWGTHQCLPLQAAGFYLNPKFFYRIGDHMPGGIVSAVFDCIERLIPDAEIQDKITKELNLYKNAVGDFGRKMAVRARDTMLPDEWWSTYGGSCPNLARFAIRILSQRGSLIHFKRQLIPFEQIHQTKNSLEHQRLRDLVFTQYNLRLREEMAPKSKQKDFLDPTAFDANISGVEDWLAGKELYLEDYGNTDWMSVEPPSSKTAPAKPPLSDEFEGWGFDDHEIFSLVQAEGPM